MMIAAIIITVIITAVILSCHNLVLDAVWIVLDCSSTSSELAVPRF